MRLGQQKRSDDEVRQLVRYGAGQREYCDAPHGVAHGAQERVEDKQRHHARDESRVMQIRAQIFHALIVQYVTEASLSPVAHFGQRRNRRLTVGQRQLIAGQRPSGPAVAAGPVKLHFRLLCHFQSIVDLDTEVTHSALQFGVPEQELNSSEVLGPTIDQCRLSSPHQMRTVPGRVETNLLDPAVDDPRVLPRSQMRRSMDPTGEQAAIRLRRYA